MKKLFLVVLLSSLCLSASEAQMAQVETYTVAQRSKKSPKRATKLPAKRKAISRRASPSNGSELSAALRLAKAGNYADASIKLFQLSLSPRYRSQRTQIKYILGLMLYQMKLNQVAAFQFISVIREGNTKYLRQSLEKLSLAADALGDDTLLNYAISRVKVDQFPRVHRDMLYFRIGEYQLRNKQFKSAADSFSRVNTSSPLYSQAKYQQGLAYAEAQDVKRALASFNDLLDSKSQAPVTDSARVAGLMGKARVYYQGQAWDRSIETYREVPRDTEAWHDTLFESSWAMLRSGRFRSALSNFQSLHSEYYESFYLPESLLLRAIVYLYICKYDEMDKVLSLYNKIYKPVYQTLKTYIGSTSSPLTTYGEVVKYMADYAKYGEEINASGYRLPLLVLRKISKEGDFQRSYDYIQRLSAEEGRIKALSSQWQNSGIGRYAKKILSTRADKAKKKAGRQLNGHLQNIRAELLDLFEQEGFIRYEMLNAKKESIKKKVSGKDLPDVQVDEQNNRDYYIQNGYEYWTFRGEYWLDELGNYHYVGTQSCE